MSRLLLALLVSLLPLHAQETLFRQVADTKTDTHIEAMALFSNPSLGGFHPVRITISNNQKIPHRVFLDFTDKTNYSQGISSSSSFSFEAAPGKVVVTDILVPLTVQNGDHNYPSFSVRLSGTMGKAQGSANTVFSPTQPCVLLSEALYTPNGSALDTEASSRGSSGYGGSRNFSSKFDPKRLPDDWRAFSGFDTIMLTEADWADIPPGPRNGIVSWVRLGGQLVVYSGGDPSPASLGLPEDPGFGEILIESIAPSLTLNTKNAVDLAYHKRAIKHRLASISSDFNSTWPLQKAFGEKSFNYILFVLILLAFGILVGPVNLFVFAKSGRRHRLFITTPLISIGTSLILIALIIFEDGFGGNGTRLTLMEVRPDGNQNAAFIQQEQFSRSGVMTSPSFTVETPALVAQTPLASSRWARFTSGYGSSGAYDLQPTSGGLFASGDWFQSRSEQGQLVTAVVPTRGRIEATNDPGTVVSTFDFPIEMILYRDPTGQWHRGENIGKGKPAKLTPVDPTMVQPILNDTAKRFTDRNNAFLRRVSDRNDSYIAFAKQAPAVETHPGIDWQSDTVITGPIAR
ncbi:MAG: hypothetical protein RLZZ505_1404 [Verrucomicrobiota bacterium]|jgi:hypothetical protein